MCEVIWNPDESEYSSICVAIYDGNKIGFLCYQGEQTDQSLISTPTYTVEQTKGIIAHLDKAFAHKGLDFDDVYAYQNSEPYKYLYIAAHTLPKTGRNWFYVTSICYHGNWDDVEDVMFGRDGLYQLKHHLQLAIDRIVSESYDVSAC